jgi:hypothetical protein
MTLRVDHPRRPGQFKLLRRLASSFLVIALLGILGGLMSLEETVWPLLAGLMGSGLVAGLSVYVSRLQRTYESAYLNLDDLGLSVGGVDGSRRFGWDELEAAAVVRLGSRLMLSPRSGAPAFFPLAAWMRRLDEGGEGRLTPEELVALLGARLPVRVEGLEGGPEPRGAGFLRALDVLLFACSAFLLLLHGLAVVFAVAPGAWLARAGLLAFGLLGALIGLRGLLARTLVTAVGNLRGRAARGLGWLGFLTAVLCVGLAALL